jgi:biotin carboxylase
MTAIALFDPLSSGEKLKNAAREAGYKVVAVFTSPMKFYEEIYHAKEEDLRRDCDAVVIAQDKEEILQKLRALPMTICAAIAATEGGVEAADWIANTLNFWGNPLAFSKARRDKAEMRKLLKKSGLSCPSFAICYNEKEVVQFAENHLFPLIIKTPKGAMTSQVYECENLKELLYGFQSILGQPDIYGFHPSHCVVEEYISGPEYILDTFSDGETVHMTDIWIYEKIHSDFYKNIYYNCISLPLSDPALGPLIRYGISIVRLFGIERGAAHIELKDDPLRGPTLIEIGARLAGVRIPELIKKYTNFDPYQSSIDVFVRGKTTIPDPVVYQKQLALAFFPQMKGGKVRQISGIKEIQELSSYDSLLLGAQKGDLIPPSTYLATIPLLGFFANPDRKQLLQDVAAAHQLFTIDYE